MNFIELHQNGQARYINLDNVFSIEQYTSENEKYHSIITLKNNNVFHYFDETYDYIINKINKE